MLLMRKAARIQPVLKLGLQHIRVEADKSIWQRLRRNVSISVVGSGFSVAIKLGQTILLTKFLKIDDYGRVLIVLNLFIFLDSFFGLRVSDVMFRFFQPLREQGNARALKGLLLFCLGICLASGLPIYVGVLIVSPWLARHLYSNPGLSTLFNIYGCTVLVSAFSGIYQPILRIYDRFSAIVVPQILGSLLTLAILFTYFATTNGESHDLRVIVAAFAVGSLVQTIPPLVKALRLVRPFLVHVEAGEDMPGLAKSRPELVRCLFNSNLSGYLKFAIDPGDVFLLGLFSSPTQVALYGLAKQLTSPLALLQTTIQTAITPEITTLIAKLKLQQLRRLVTRYVRSAFVFGGLLLLSAILLGRLMILHFFPAQYVTALPIFYCLVVAAWLLLVFLAFRPLAVSLDLLRWHNLALLVSAVIVVVLIVAGELSALTMAYVQLAEAAILRLAFSLLVWKKLRDSRDGTPADLVRPSH
jgi:O-antigen/teichoic acid export membrane protein